MAPALPELAAASANTPTVANTGFRLGEEQQFSDASDSDQSQTSQRSASLRRANGLAPATKSKNKKLKDRRKMGALADELVDVLGGAFSTPKADLQTTGSAQQPNGDQTMAIDSVPAGKKMNKRTRQNLAKMQARKERKVANPKMDMSKDKTLQAQVAAAERRGMSLDEYRKISSGKGMSRAAARRAKKDATRKERAAAVVDEMDIG